MKCQNPVRNHGKKFMNNNGKTLTEDELECVKSDEIWTKVGRHLLILC